MDHDFSWTDSVYKNIWFAPGYRVTSCGLVLSCWKRKGLGWGNGTEVVMSDDWVSIGNCLDEDGYKKVILCIKKRREYWRVSNLILYVFLGFKKGKVVCHNDGNILNNDVRNLRWDTQKGNIQDKIRHGTWQRGEKHGCSLLKEYQVLEILKKLSSGVSGVSISKEYKISPSTVSAIKHKRLWSYLSLKENS